MNDACATSRRPRVLICTVSAWDDDIGGDTYPMLFRDYGSSQLANLYIREETPRSRVCGRYFRISESSVIRSIFRRDVETGREFRGSHHEPDTADLRAIEQTRSRYERHRRRRPWLLLYAREVLWKLGRWRSPELDAFLQDFNPEVVLFGMEGYLHFNRINRYIIDHTGARGIGYFYDDHFTYKQKPWSLGHRIYRFFQRRDLKKSVAMCSAFFAISPKTKHECDAFFGIDSVLLTKPVTAEGAGWLPYVPGYPLRMLYTGNLLIGRRESISLLGRAMGLVNSDKVRVVLDVYTTTSLSPQEVLSIDPSVRIHQAVSRAEVLELQREADVLLFVEDLLGAERKTARLSFSTKLTEYLACGKCIFAIGDAENSPIEYLRSERAAVCASSSDEILNQLRTLCDTPALVADYGRRAYECGLRNHGERVVRSRLYEVLTSGHTPDMTVCG